MEHLITFVLGIAMGMYLYAQSNAIHMPVFHLSKHIQLDNGLLFAIAVLIAALFLRAKTTGGRRGGRK